MKMNNKGLKFLTVLSIIAVVLAFSVVLVSATDAEPNVSNTWYVDQTAENAGTGSQADPFKAFSSAIDAANDGDTIKFIGDYTTTNEDKINLKGKGVTITSADTENVSTITGIISLSEDAWNTATHPITGDLGFVDLQMSLESMIGWEGSYDPDAEPGTCGALRTETVNGITITFNGCTFDSDCYDSTIRLCDVGSIDVIISECTFHHSGETRESGSDMRAVALSSYNANSGSTLTVSDSVFTNYQRSIYVTNFTSLDVQDSEITPHPTKKTGKTSINIAGAVQGLEVFVDNVTLNDNPEGKPFVLFHDSADGCSIKSFEVHGDVYTDDGDGKTLTIAQNGTFIVPDDGSFNLGYGGHDWTLVNSGSIVDSGAIINGGIITNNGQITISNESGAEALVIDGATAKITGNANKTGKIISSAAYPIIIKQGTIENQTIDLGVVASYGITMTAENGNVALKDNSITSSGERFVAVNISATGKQATISGNTFIQGDASKGIKSVLMVGPGEAVAWPENTVVTITDNDFSKVTKYRETFGAGGGHEAGAHAYDSKSIRILAQTAKIGLSTEDGAQIVVDNDADIGMVSGTTNDAHEAPADWTWVKESDVQIVSSMSLNSLGILDGKVTIPAEKTLAVKNLQVAGPMIVNGTLIVTGGSVINSDSYPEADQWDTGSITIAADGILTNTGAITNDAIITNNGIIYNDGTVTGEGIVINNGIIVEDEAQHVSTFAGLVAALENGGTVIMDDDITITATVTVDDESTLDLNSNILTISEGDIQLLVSGTVCVDGELVLSAWDDLETIDDGAIMFYQGDLLTVGGDCFVGEVLTLDDKDSSLIVTVDDNNNYCWTVCGNATIESGETFELEADELLIVTAASELSIEGRLVVDQTPEHEAELTAIGLVSVSGKLECGEDKLIGDSSDYIIQIAPGAGVVSFIVNGDGFDFAIEGNVTIPEGKTFELVALDTLTVNGTIDLKGTIESAGLITIAPTGKIIGGGIIDFSGAAEGTKVISAPAGAQLTVTLVGDAEADKSKLVLENIVAGEGGITVTRGSVIIDGVIATPDAEGKITVPAGSTVYVSGVVDTGVTLEIPATSTVVIQAGNSLVIEDGAAVVNNGTIDLDAAGSEVIYEKGSVINGEVIETTTKEDKSGRHVAIIIWLVSEDNEKLAISVPFVEAFAGATYGEILSLVQVTPLKKSVTFTGWYNTAMVEKITSNTVILPYEHTVTACFDIEKKIPVIPDDDDDSGSSVVPASSSNINEFALPIAFILLVCSIFALGFVIIRKK